MSLLSTMMQVVFLLLTLAITVLGKPLAFRPRDAISPPITNPTASSVWKAGDRQTVTWDLSGLNGAQPSNPIGKVILGTFINGEEHLLLESPLASGFNILDGNVTLTVPTVATGSDYIVCLFGSSGDISAPFTIIGTDASTSTSTSVSASATASAPASTHINAASSSNTLPPHETADPSTTISLPHGVPVTGDPSSAPTTSASASATGSSLTTALASIPSGVVPPSGTPATPSTATSPSASATGTSASSSTGTAVASTSTGNSGARMTAANIHLWGIVSGALAIFALL